MQTNHKTLRLKDGRKVILRPLNDPEIEEIKRLLQRNVAMSFAVEFALRQGATVLSTTVNGEEIHLVSSPPPLLEQALKTALQIDMRENDWQISEETLENIFNSADMIIYEGRIYPTHRWGLWKRVNCARDSSVTVDPFEKTPSQNVFLASIKNDLSPTVECLIWEDKQNGAL